MIRTKNKIVFIPDKAPYQHKVCAPIWNISHIVPSLLQCGLQRNDQYRTHNQRLVPHLLPSNLQRKEQLGQCPNLVECQTESDSGKPFSSVFLKYQEEHSTQADWLGFSDLFYLFFLSCFNKFFIRWTRYFLCCSTTRISFRFRLGTGLISDDRRASAEVNGEKLAELNDGRSLVFTKAGWFTRAASLSFEDRGKSYGLKMFLSQGKRPVARKPLATISPVAARLYAFANSSPIW